MFPLANGETVVRERGSLVTDRYSGTTTKRDWTNPAKLEIEGVAIAPSSATETRTEDRATLTTAMSLYGPPGIDVQPFDRIRARSGLWEVEGETTDWRSPFSGWNPGVEIRIKKVVG